MELTWLGAAGFKLDTREGATLLIDPFLSRPNQAYPLLPLRLTDLYPVDEILLTNGRFDHAMDTPALAAQTGALVHATRPICERLAELGVSQHSLQVLTMKKSKGLGRLTWQAFPGLVNQLDSSPVLRALTNNPRNLAVAQELDRLWPPGDMVAYHLQAEGLSLVHFGSAGWIEAEIQPLQPDIALLPVEYHADTNSAVVQLAAILTPQIIIPHHWDNYYPPLSRQINLKEFAAALNIVAPRVKIYIPKIGQSFNPAGLL